MSPRRTSDAAAGAVGPSGWLDDQRHELARTQLLDAAARLFAEHGVVAVGMADVARAAGCSRATMTPLTSTPGCSPSKKTPAWQQPT